MMAVIISATMPSEVIVNGVDNGTAIETKKGE
jgi:hypothetical protein